MIYATVNMTIGDYKSICDNKIVLYRGDKNVEIRIIMKGNKFTVLDSTYAQMIIRRPSTTSVFSEPAPIQNDTVVFTITEDMIDELKEIGEYTFQVRLYDNTMTARATLPPCESALIIEKPIAVEGEAAVNLAIVNDSAVMLADTTISEEDIFTEDGEYNRTIWKDGDLITDARLNKIEEALYYINENGGGSGATAPYISTELSENVMVGVGANFNLYLDFNSPNMGKGTLKVFINDVDSMSIKIDQGETVTVIPGELFIKGTNQVIVYVLDRVGVMSNSLTFYVRYGSTELASDFDAYSAYDYGATVRYYFTPTALDTSLTLTFYMSIDGAVQQGVPCTSDTRGYYTFPSNLSADSHYCEAYVIDSNGTKSNVLAFNLIILSTNTIVVASDTKSATIEEGSQLALDYKVYMKNNLSFITKTYVDNVLVNTGTCGLDFNYYRTSSLTEGIHTIKMEVWDTTETYSDYITWTVTVTESTFEVIQPANAGAMFITTAVNKSNTDERRNELIGKDETGVEITGTLHNFAFNSESGWIDDELIISGNSHVEIPIQPLANNARYGFTLDLEFTSRQIGVEDAEVLTLWNEETDCGIRITTENLILRSAEGNECNLYYSDNERTNVMFIIDRNERTAKIYLNGVMCEAFHLSDYSVDGVTYLEDFTVNSNLILGGYNKNGYSKIRNLRIYNIALTTDEIINNWISCEIDKGKQRELVEFQKGNELPTMYIYCDFSGLGKDDKKPCRIVYHSTDEVKYGKSFNLDHKQSTCQYQGTSSMAYPIKNYRINLADETGEKWKYDFPGGQPEHRFTLKADFMNSCHAHNTGMAKFINDNLYNYKLDDEKSMNPFKWHHIQNGGDINDFREAINGFPCRLILVNDGSTPLNEGQNEPTPGNTKDMGIFNFNNDKDATATLGFDSDIFPNCASYEVTANSDTSAGAFMSFKSFNPIDYYADSNDTNAFTVFLPTSLFLKNDENTFESDKTIAQIDYHEEDTTWKNYKTVNSLSTTIPKSEYYYIKIKFNGIPSYLIANGDKYDMGDRLSDNSSIYKNESDTASELDYIKQSFELRYPDSDDVSEDWGFMGIESNVYRLDYWDDKSNNNRRTEGVPCEGMTSIKATKASRIACYGSSGFIGTVYFQNEIVTPLNGTTHAVIIFDGQDVNDFMLNDTICYMRNPLPNLVTTLGTLKEEVGMNTTLSLKALIDWVDNCTDEEFVRDFEQHFHKDYTLRYYALVVLIGAVDNLGKNMMLDTADNKIFFPRFYDIDTILSYDNSGAIKFDVDIEMEQGYWNTSSSRLWTRIRELMHNDVVAIYNDMRQNGVSYENIMKYMYDEQISKIPQTYYNKDYDVKYAPFADSYMGMAHGNGYEHMKRWLKNRFIFCDTLFDYAPSYNNDMLTIRVNTTEPIEFEIETYTPVYQHLSWYNGQMDKKKIDGKTSVSFTGTVQAATDQEVLIYGGSNVKSIKGIQSGNPNRLILGSATKLVELDAHDCPLLSEINMNKANLAPHEYLTKVNLRNCPLLGGNLILNNSPLIQEVDIRGTGITGLNLPSSIRNLEILRLPNGISNLTLNDAGMLHTLECDEGIALNSINMTNCNALENVIGLDLLQTPSITLDNSYNNVSELYFRDTTNLTVRNMSNLERLIYTPNNEYETFELINVANAPDYKVTTFNCPKLSTFVTTAPYRESYNNCGTVDKEIIIGDISETIDLILIRGTGFNSDGSLSTGKANTCYADEIFYKVKVGTTCSIEKDGNWSYIVEYNQNKEFVRAVYTGNNTEDTIYSWVAQNPYVRIGANNGTFIKLTRTYEEVNIIQVKDYGDIQPNTTFTANNLDISNTQFTDIKLLCTTDVNTLKLPITVKNFYCDSSFDLDTDYLEDGDYDIIHNELIEEYTTDYKDEVVLINAEKVFINVTEMKGYVYAAGTNQNPNSIPMEGTSATLCCVDFTRVIPNKNVVCNMDWNNIYFFTKDKQFISETGQGSSAVIPSTAYYMRLNIPMSNVWYYTIEYDSPQERIPNLTPSSADGSIIMSMYAPSNTVAPSSGIWDLKGLQFDNFHTYGMNNDVKGEYGLSLDITNLERFENWKHHYTGTDGFAQPLYTLDYDCIVPFYIGTNSKVSVSADNGGKVSIQHALEITGSVARSEGEGVITVDRGYPYIGISFNKDAKFIYLTIDEIQYKISVGDMPISSNQNPDKVYFREHMMDFNDIKKEISLDETPKSITMPARYDDYNITIKNADISPTTHNTMLYPLLVNEDNPITGTLDYTNYEGNYLSWSFAYTDLDKVDIIQPREDLLNSYEYTYNAFYDTEFEFDNPFEVAIYTCKASGVLPTFNTAFTYTYDEIDNGDGTYTTKIYADSLDNLPTEVHFSSSNLITVDKLNTNNVKTGFNMFRQCTNLTHINCKLNTNNMISTQSMFFNCSRLISLDLSNWNIGKVTNMNSMFYGCSSLTSLDVSNWDTSQVTDMASMLYNCTSLTSLDVSNWDTSQVTTMQSIFNRCAKLVTLDVSGFDTSNVTNMRSMFQNCSELTSLDVSNWDTSQVKDMSYMFANCNALTEIIGLNTWDTNKVTNMEQTFAACKVLTSLDLSGWDIASVTNMTWLFNECYQLTSLNSMKNISRSLELSSTKLDTESLLDVIDNLATVTTTRTLTLGSTLLAKITGDQIAIATNKGWTVV